MTALKQYYVIKIIPSYFLKDFPVEPKGYMSPQKHNHLICLKIYGFEVFWLIFYTNEFSESGVARQLQM